MINIKVKWLIYTVLVGLIPIISRILVWGVTQAGTVNWIAAADFIAFGLILHISNINEIEHLSDEDKSWKTIQNGTSILFIALYSILFCLAMISEGSQKLVDADIITICVFFLAVVSFSISYSIYHRISKIRAPKETK